MGLYLKQVEKEPWKYKKNFSLYYKRVMADKGQDIIENEHQVTV